MAETEQTREGTRPQNEANGETDDVIVPHFGPDSIKWMAESIGVPLLQDEAAKELAEDVTYRVKKLIQDSQKFMFHGKRRKLHCEDIDMGLRLEGQEPTYGIHAQEHIPFRYASGGGRELHFIEDKEIDLFELTTGQLPKIPLGVSLRAHWLAIEGTQPSIPENPPAQSKEQLKTENADPLVKLKKSDARENKLGTLLSKPTKVKTMETMNIKQLATHELSVEQQLYYKEITEACVGSDEGRRAEALQSLACDPGLHQMLPRLCTFIAEGVRVNVVQHNLAILIYLMRMVKSLLENQTLFLEKYLHELIPAVTTCIVSRQLCSRPDVDNHWALRDFASRLMANICKNFNTSTNNIQTRITRMFSESLQNEHTPLVSYYGALAGLQELGPEVVKVFILPYVTQIGHRIEHAIGQTIQSTATNIDKIAASKIRTLIVKSLCPVLKSVRSPPDNLEEYKAEYGATLAQYLHEGVVRSRQQSAARSSSTVTSTPTSRIAGATPIPRTAAPAQQMIIVSNVATPTAVRVATPTTPTTPKIVTQKIVVQGATPQPQTQQANKSYFVPPGGGSQL